MNKEKRRALETAGFVFEDTEDFLELTAEERQLVELRLVVCRAILRGGSSRASTQEQVARKLKSSQSRVAKMEAGAADVSLDLLFRGFFALGGTLKDLRLVLNRWRSGRGRGRSPGPGRVEHGAGGPGGHAAGRPDRSPSAASPAQLTTSPLVQDRRDDIPMCARARRPDAAGVSL